MIRYFQVYQSFALMIFFLKPSTNKILPAPYLGNGEILITSGCSMADIESISRASTLFFFEVCFSSFCPHKVLLALHQENEEILITRW